jgi:hypothetical protein
MITFVAEGLRGSAPNSLGFLALMNRNNTATRLS